MEFARLNVLQEQAPVTCQCRSVAQTQFVAKYLENKVLRGCETPAGKIAGRRLDLGQCCRRLREPTEV